jgi:hypothetical protein
MIDNASALPIPGLRYHHVDHIEQTHGCLAGMTRATVNAARPYLPFSINDSSDLSVRR